MSDSDRLRLLTLGGPKTGKTSIIKRFLFNTYCEKYKSTVEELYNREYDFGNIKLRIDIMDTGGDVQFPAMRRLSISTTHAFLLVYAVDDPDSFDTVKSCFEEIKEARADYQDIPIVVVGNKSDLLVKEVNEEDVRAWLQSLGKLRTQFLEASAKDESNIREIFKSFLTLSQISIQSSDDQGLKRRSSAYVKTRGGKGNTSSATDSPSKIVQKSPQFLSEDSAKPRSRSLIRRSSRKAKQNVRDASSGGGPGECGVV